MGDAVSPNGTSPLIKTPAAVAANHRSSVLSPIRCINPFGPRPATCEPSATAAIKAAVRDTGDLDASKGVEAKAT